MRISGIGAPELSAAKSFGQNKTQNRRRSRDNKPNSDTILPPALDNNSLAINIPVEACVSYTSVDGDPLPLLSGWLRKRSRKRRSWDRRYFYIEPDEKRLYYLQNGPMIENSDDNLNLSDNNGGVYQSIGKFISSTYHKIVDGDEASNESFIDLRLIPDVYTVPGGKKIDKCCFDIDLGYRVLKVKCETEAECRFWVDNLNKWREWAHSASGNNSIDSSMSSRRDSGGYSTDGSQGGDNAIEEIRGRLPCEPESSANARREWTVVRRRNSKGGRRGAEELESRGSSIASEDSEYGSRHLEKFLTSPSDYGRRVNSNDSVASNAFASLSYYGSDSNSRSNSSGHSSGSGNNSRGSSASHVRKFPGSIGRSSSLRNAESYDTARGDTEGRSTSGSAWGSGNEEDIAAGGGGGREEWFDQDEPFTPQMSPIPVEIMSPISHKKNRHSNVVDVGQLEALSLNSPPLSSLHDLGNLTPINLGSPPSVENQFISPMEHNMGKLEPLTLPPSINLADQNNDIIQDVNNNMKNNNNHHTDGTGSGGSGESFDQGSSSRRKKKVKSKSKHSKKKKSKDPIVQDQISGGGGGGEEVNTAVIPRSSGVLRNQRASSVEEDRNIERIQSMGTERFIRRSTSVPIEPIISLKLSQVTRLPRPTDPSSLSPPSMTRSSSSASSGNLSQKWKDYPTQLNIDHDDDYGV